MKTKIIKGGRGCKYAGWCKKNEMGLTQKKVK